MAYQFFFSIQIMMLELLGMEDPPIGNVDIQLVFNSLSFDHRILELDC
jgi:hypothetical protein